MLFPSLLLIVGLVLGGALPALPCTCVVAEDNTAKTAMGYVSVVFHGTVIERKTLPQHPEMRGRGRYAITFRVNEYWKGSRGRRVIVYGVDDGADCRGDGGYDVGKNYLVYADEVEARDVVLKNGRFLYGWPDVLANGTKMLIPRTACMHRKGLRRDFGKGRIPPSMATPD